MNKPLGELPEWIKLAAPDARISAKDIFKLFGYRTPEGIHCAVHEGCFPKPDSDGARFRPYPYVMPNDIGRNRSRSVFWKKATVLAEYRRRMSKVANQKEI